MLALAPPLVARLPLLAACFFGQGLEEGRGVFWADVESFRICADEPFPVQADGDDLSCTPCTVKAAPKALNLVFPE